MARRRKKGFGWGARIFALLALVAMVGGAWLWWDTRHWTPSEDEYPDQGVLVSQNDGAVNFRTLKALGADFAYLHASTGGTQHDSRFAANLQAAQVARLQVGAVHSYDPCLAADAQSANFVTMVPRGGDFLPPAIELSATAESCEESVPEAAVASELMTLINQIEMHTGKPVILKLGRAFEDAYAMAHRLDRGLWVERTRLPPTYAGRPWLLWTANEALQTEASEAPVQWVVVQR